MSGTNYRVESGFLSAVGGETGSTNYQIMQSNMEPIFILASVCLPNDVDCDAWTADVDCDDNDYTVNPAGTEIVNNGKDDDCNPATPVNTASGLGLNQPLPGFNASLQVSVDGANPGVGLVKYRYSRERLTFASTAISSISASGGTATITGTGNATRTGGASCTGCPFTVTIVEDSPDGTSISINNGAYFKDPASGTRALTSGNFNQTGQ
ncbi:MAG: putative metal-binding motif-containing protein [Nitrospirae bacterium]|nr:putative metal-binding motif-containing protein [Nitrospirota bacterium]